ncbi:MAG: hypothetical protein BWY99_02881 [Synergistetes bacterium ADurb.BinA166]|nr:MAG: hypothetical protein BWY99_02881 [Synergistetes bacterium ADurb.BinA166]
MRTCWSCLAILYSEFSLRSPCSRAVAMALEFSGIFLETMVSYSSRLRS